MRRFLALSKIAIAFVVAGAVEAHAFELQPEDRQLATFLEQVCQLANAPADELKRSFGSNTEIEDRGTAVSSLARAVTVSQSNGGRFRAQLLTIQRQVRRAQADRLKPAGSGQQRPVLNLRAGQSCAIAGGRKIVFDANGVAERLVDLDEKLKPTGQEEPLNPPVPDGKDPGGVLVAHIDSGVNYTLPFIAERLARSAGGRILGYDYWDDDDRPYDVDAARSPFFPSHHGTLVASTLLREARGMRLLPYRYPRNDMRKMEQLVERVAEHGARIVAMPLGSNQKDQWAAFLSAAAANPDILFIVSAGNNGRDIDAQPIYPASAELPNILTVTSSTVSGRIAQDSNWGVNSVDVMVPAERLPVIDHRGAEGRASGSSHAVPRVAALAARMLARNPDWKAPELKAAIKALAAPSFDRSGPKTRWGWIPNPADDG